MPSNEPWPVEPIWRNWLFRHITVVLVIKVLLVFGLWYAFFRQPDQAPIAGAEVGAHLLGNRPVPVSTGYETKEMKR